jgi:hypothetical protein
VPKDIQDRAEQIFKYPTKFVTLSNPSSWNDALAGLGSRPLNKLLKDRGIEASRIALLGFSASCTAVRMVLNSADGGYVDSAIAIDGIHAGVDVWADFARLAAFGGAAEMGLQPGSRSCIITHSQVEPEYTSTTETAQQIVEDVFGGAVTHEGPSVSPMMTSIMTEPVDIGCSWHSNRYTYDRMPFWYQVNKGGLHVLGYENIDPTGCTDHIFQAKVLLPRAIEFVLAPRWANPPPTGTCMVSV